MAFATRTRRPPRTLSDAETAKILRLTGEHRDGFRDHVILSVALGMALRESEIVGLDVRDVSNDGRRPKRTIHLRVFKRAGVDIDPSAQRVPVPDGTYYKLEKYLRLMKLELDEPLFPSRQSSRLSARRLRSVFREWQILAGFSKPYHFHALRHTACTNLYRRTRDIHVVARFARHANIATTTIYTHVSDEELREAAKDLAS
jgi:integrase/recombinase XerC